MVHDRRLTEWIDLTGDLLQRPLREFPAETIGQQLNRTYSVTAVSWGWRDTPSHVGFEVWPELDSNPLSRLSLWQLNAFLDRHPLVRWFVVTQSPAPQSVTRVPSELAPKRDVQLVADFFRPMGVEQQLSIPYRLHQHNFGAFVLGRPDVDFDDEDLELAGHLQRLIRGLHRRTSPVARASRPAGRCSAAERAGLTATELAVLTLLGEGHTAYGIALRLDMAPGTATKHIQHIYRKLSVHDRLAAVLVSRESGIIRR